MGKTFGYDFSATSCLYIDIGKDQPFMDRYATYSAKPHPTLSHLKRSLLYLSMAIKDEREAFYDSKTSCFGVVESLSITVKYHSFRTKTTCFTVIMVCDALGRKVMLHHKPIVNELKAIMMLFTKKYFFMRTNHYFLTHSERLVCQNIRIGNIGYLIEGLIFSSDFNCNLSINLEITLSFAVFYIMAIQQLIYNKTLAYSSNILFCVECVVQVGPVPDVF